MGQKRIGFGVAVVVGALLAGSACAESVSSGAGNWSARCEFDGQAFELRFATMGDEPDNANTTVTLVSADGKRVMLPLSPGYYRSREVVSNRPSLCTGIGAFAADDQVYKAEKPKLLLWLSVDNRPGWDTLSLVLLDVPMATVVHQAERVGPIKDPDGQQGLAVQVTPEGWSVRLERQWLQNTGTDSAENSIEDWMLVSVAHGRIRTQWQ